MSGSTPGQAETAKVEDGSEEDTQKSRQDTINLVVSFAPLYPAHTMAEHAWHRAWTPNAFRIFSFTII